MKSPSETSPLKHLSELIALVKMIIRSLNCEERGREGRDIKTHTAVAVSAIFISVIRDTATQLLQEDSWHTTTNLIVNVVY